MVRFRTSILIYYVQIFAHFKNILFEIYRNNISTAILKNGLSFDSCGRYEQVGYSLRTFDFIQGLLHFYQIEKSLIRDLKPDFYYNVFTELINNNSVASCPLLDIHSNTIIDIVKFYIEMNRRDGAVNYLRNLIEFLIWRKELKGVLPDTNNHVENVIKCAASGVKPIHYSDQTSPLLTAVVELCIILDMKVVYYKLQEFIKKNKIDLGIFVPHHGSNSTSRHLIEDRRNDLEEQLFSKSVNDGYQSEVRLVDFEIGDMDFEQAKLKMLDRKNEFEYDYRTDKTGLKVMRDIAHYYLKTPYFPDNWRFLLTIE